MIYKTVLLSTGLLEALGFYIIFDSVLKRRENINNFIYVLCMFITGMLINISFLHIGPGLLNTTSMYAILLIFSFMFKIGIKKSILVILIGMSVNACIEMTVLYSLGALFDVSSYILVTDETMWIGGALFSKFLFLVFAKFISLKYKNKKLLVKTSFWLLLVIVFMPSITTSFIIFRLLYNVSDPLVYNIALFSSAGLMLSSFVAIYLYEHISTQSEIIMREQRYKQQLDAQSKHIDDILIMQNRMKSFRHDINNHWIALNGFFSKGDCEGGIRYIEKIRGILDDSEITNTGNIAFDALLSTKKAISLKKGIAFDSTVQIPAQLSINAADICIIFGNALDNAIEACDRISSGEKYIRLSVIYGDGSLICKITNSIGKTLKKKVKVVKAVHDSRGFGMENIKHSLSAYKHIFKTEYTDNEFVLSFIIFDV